ncbi:MAG: CpsD/CapB family tyrosine-protein kinase, partial [Leptolyngbyaceae cyanobacterium]
RQLPQLARQYADLQRELALATESLNKFLARREGLEIDAAQQEVPWELFAAPSVGAMPNGSNFSQLVMTAVLSILLGVGVGLLVEISQDVLRSPNEVKRLTGLPLLGVVPRRDGETVETDKTWQPEMPSTQTSPDLDLAGLFNTIKGSPEQNGYGASVSGNSRSYLYYNDSPFTESIRSLYKNIRMLKGWDTPIRSLAISSAQPGDGKSTIATNLALVAAAMGQRVLLVDADLRQPNVHHLMNLPNQYGLSDILSSNQDIQTCLQQAPTEERLTVLTAGQTALDPASALSSKKMRLLMDQFQMEFDIVIYDTPPLVGLADSGIIANHTDGLAIVVRLDKTKAAKIKYALDEMSLHSTPVLGIIANGSQETVSTVKNYYRAQPQAVVSN